MTHNLAFPTEIPEWRPSTTVRNKSMRQTDQSLHLALKRTKQEARLAEKRFSEEMVKHHQVKR